MVLSDRDYTAENACPHTGLQEKVPLWKKLVINYGSGFPVPAKDILRLGYVNHVCMLIVCFVPMLSPQYINPRCLHINVIFYIYNFRIFGQLKRVQPVTLLV